MTGLRTGQGTGMTAIEALKAGNERFVKGAGHRVVSHHDDRVRPIAMVLGCCDHRVPPEVVFDQGLSELLVIRVAGNIAGQTQLGSIEYGAQALGIRLVVVLGHQHCGAISATLDARLDGRRPESPHLGEIVDQIMPACAACGGGDASREAMAHELTIANIRRGAERLRTGSPVLRALIETDALRVVGAHYSVDAGTVEFLGD